MQGMYQIGPTLEPTLTISLDLSWDQIDYTWICLEQCLKINHCTLRNDAESILQQ